MKKFKEEFTVLFILFALLAFFYIVVKINESNKNPQVLKQENKLLNEFANKNKISIFRKQENYLDGNTIIAKGEICYNGLINKIIFKAHQNGNIEILYLEPKKIKIENSSSTGVSLILIGGYNSDGSKYNIIKCKNSINRIKF